MGKKVIPKPNRNAPAIPKYVPKPKEFRPTGNNGCLRIRLTNVDVGGPWCLTSIERNHFVDLLQRLKSFESVPCTRLFGPGSEEGKVYLVEQLPNRYARDRLVELELDDQTEIARLRINGKRRLYGFLPDGGPDSLLSGGTLNTRSGHRRRNTPDQHLGGWIDGAVEVGSAHTDARDQASTADMNQTVP